MGEKSITEGEIAAHILCDLLLLYLFHHFHFATLTLNNVSIRFVGTGVCQFER